MPAALGAPVTLRTGAAAPRVVGSEYGGYHGRSVGTAKLYGSPDDRCPTCGALLNAYNEYDRCACHCDGSERKRPPRIGGTPASAAGESGTNAAPEPRHTTQEEIEMAAAERRRNGEVKEAIAAAAEKRDGWFNAIDIAEEVGCSIKTVQNRLGAMVQSGKFESSKHRGYRKRDDAAVVAAERARERDGSSARRDEDRLRIRTFAASKGSTWFTSRQAQQYAECSHKMARKYLGQLVKEGVLESAPRRGYRVPQAQATECDKPDSIIDGKVTSAARKPAESEPVKDESPAHEAVHPGQNPGHQEDAERASDHGRALPPESAVDGSGRSGDVLDIALGALTAYGSPSSEGEESATPAPVSPPGAAPEVPPERSSAATPVPPAVPQGSPAAESLRAVRGFAGISPFAGQLIQPDALLVTSDPELVVINYLAAMAPEQRDRTLQFAVAKWWPFEKEA